MRVHHPRTFSFAGAVPVGNQTSLADCELERPGHRCCRERPELLCLTLATMAQDTEDDDGDDSLRGAENVERGEGKAPAPGTIPAGEYLLAADGRSAEPASSDEAVRTTELPSTPKAPTEPVPTTDLPSTEIPSTDAAPVGLVHAVEDTLDVSPAVSSAEDVAAGVEQRLDEKKRELLQRKLSRTMVSESPPALSGPPSSPSLEDTLPEGSAPSPKARAKATPASSAGWIVGGVLVVAASLAWLSSRGVEEARPKTASRSSASSNVATTVSVRFVDAPPDTAVWLGSRLVGAAPGPLAVAKGNDAIELRLISDGFSTKVVSFVPNQDQVIQIRMLTKKVPADETPVSPPGSASIVSPSVAHGLAGAAARSKGGESGP